MDLNVIASSAGPPLVFMLAIWFLTLTVRRLVEMFLLKSAKEHTYWKNGVLPALPIALGAGFAAVMWKFPFLNTLPSMGTRAFYGCVGGGCSGVLYRIVKTIVKKQYGVEVSVYPTAIAGTLEVKIPASELPKIDTHYPGKSENEELPDSDGPTLPALPVPLPDDSEPQPKP